MIKISLIIDSKETDITNDLKNWDDIELSFTRKDFGGIYRKFAKKFEFVKGAYDLLTDLYLSKYIESSAKIVIYRQINDLTYKEAYRCSLDFMSYSDDGHTLTLSAIDDDTYSIINSQKSQTFDIPVSDINKISLIYKRIYLNNRVSWVINPNDPDNEQTDPDVYPIRFALASEFPMVYGDANFPIKGMIEQFDIGSHVGELSYYSMTSFVKALAPVSIRLILKFDMRLDSYDMDFMPSLCLYKRKKEEIEFPKEDIAYFSGIGQIVNVNIDRGIDLEEGDELMLFIVYPNSIITYAKATLLNVKDISVTYIAKGDPVTIDAIRASDLLTSLLKKIGLKDYTGEIKTGNIPIPYIMAAESVRGIKDAKIHTSFSKFTEFAKAVLGYDWEIDDVNRKVIFKPLGDFYDSVTDPLPLTEINSMTHTIDSSVVYSGVEVGYDKQEYDEINGRDEFHFTNSFSTGIKATDNVLKLISPYRADPYGIEFLVTERNEETKDTDSDNDVFIVDAVFGSGGLTPRTMIVEPSYPITGVLFPDTMFNAAYSPRNMLMANKGYVGMSASGLMFTSSEGNADVSIKGISERGGISIEDSDRLLRSDKIKVSTIGLSPFPGNYKGRVSCSFSGKTYVGYVSDITERIGKGQTVDYELLLKNIT